MNAHRSDAGVCGLMLASRVRTSHCSADPVHSHGCQRVRMICQAIGLIPICRLCVPGDSGAGRPATRPPPVTQTPPIPVRTDPPSTTQTTTTRAAGSYPRIDSLPHDLHHDRSSVWTCGDSMWRWRCGDWTNTRSRFISSGSDSCGLRPTR